MIKNKLKENSFENEKIDEKDFLKDENKKCMREVFIYHKDTKK